MRPHSRSVRRSRSRARLTQREGIRTELPVRHPAPFTPGPPHQVPVSSHRPSGGALPAQQKQHSRQFSSSTRGGALAPSGPASNPHAPIPSRRQRLEEEDDEEDDWGEGDAFNADTEYDAGHRQSRRTRQQQQRRHDYQPRQQQQHQQQYPHTQTQWVPDPHPSYPQAHLYDEPEPLPEEPQRGYSEEVWSATGDQDNAGYGLPTYDSLPPPGQTHAQYPPAPAPVDGGAALGPRRTSIQKGPLPP
ncbi:hypothetical protein BCV69DRAFT_283589 [Microstroma glucosiphilum]|uniref:Uncharacterized protein n=1 Tax=Pseudomicrostroma glucosiphilum TaxID=1684307 RepID=A0A316U447_9BASI|nr:hypothetical protein BCV69DRAFT_283589 [Pseudomicrostroma glucosiphilum]PWN20056.1 hypothetical protein BCV69DRAFT_283589 [Pseudomicrostroma glucosiphilum]